ncbi:MAG: RsmB/NOP family class I SAM-dependent RNA methyltransferase [Lachnospiraceae bacterium]
MLPEQFLERMQTMLGEDYPAFLESLSGENYRALRVNTRKTTVEDFLKKSPFSLRRVPWTENGFYYENADQPGKHPFHEAGVYYIQEPSAMAPVPFLEVRPGERVLDLCAAPGGKTTQIADYLQGSGILVSNEIHPARARILSENVERMGVPNCVVTNETPERLAEIFPGYFDKILVDAPCSGEGMFRKNEEACTEWSRENVAGCAARQSSILECAAGMLRPGGRLVYSTCTFAPEEDEGTVSSFLKAHPEFSVVKVEKPDGFSSGMPGWIEDAAAGIADTLRLMPHRVQGEGHYLAVLKKAQAGEQLFSRNSKNGLEKSLPEKEFAEFTAFKEQYLRAGDIEGTYLRFGEQLYLGPKDMPAIKGLKVLRPGLHLGTIKKNRFEPSHALALALKPFEAAQYLNLPLNRKDVTGQWQPNPEVMQYLGGQTLIMDVQEGLAEGQEDARIVREGVTGEPVFDAKGWCLICVEGYSLGWGKLAGTIMKNHYPKGLRKG